jgi:transcriptional regulator GlxA family with amidase domain
MSFRVGILVFDGVDILDSGGPYEVFLTASRLAVRDGAEPTFEVVLMSPGGTDVTAYGGMRLTGLADAAGAGAIDIAVVPGTIDLEAAVSSSSISSAVRIMAESAELLTSVCTGSFLLAATGALSERRATTHWEDVDALAETGAVLEAVRGVRWVDEGAVITSAGLSSGIHMALHVVERYAGRDLAERTARQLDVDWNPSGQR